MKSQYKLFHQEPRSRPLYTVKERCLKSDCVLIISTYPHIDALHQLSRSRNIRIRIHSGKHIYYSNSTTSATNNYNVFLCTVTILTSFFFFFIYRKPGYVKILLPPLSINIIIITWKAIPIDKQQSMALLRISSRYVFLLYFFYIQYMATIVIFIYKQQKMNVKILINLT